MNKLLIDIINEELKKLNEVSDDLHNKIKTEYSNKKITLSRTSNIRFQDKKGNQYPSTKPNGLWYGIGSSWIDFIKSKDMEDWDYEYVFELILDDSKLLKITNIDELDQFTKKYIFNSGDYYMRDYKIDWESVAEKYSGIEIAPYIPKGRFKYKWYYGWDVASGCIWGKEAILGTKRIM